LQRGDYLNLLQHFSGKFITVFNRLLCAASCLSAPVLVFVPKRF
jgi:hypothetical protein